MVVVEEAVAVIKDVEILDQDLADSKEDEEMTTPALVVVLKVEALDLMMILVAVEVLRTVLLDLREKTLDHLVNLQVKKEVVLSFLVLNGTNNLGI